MSESDDESEFLWTTVETAQFQPYVGDTISVTSSATVDEVDTTPNELFCNIGEYIDCLGDKKCDCDSVVIDRMKKMSNTLKMVKLCLMKRLELNTFQDR